MSDIGKEIENMRAFADDFTSYVHELQSRSKDEKLYEFAKMRNYTIDIVRNAGIFYINDATEMLLPSYLDRVEDFGVISPTNKKPIFHNRYVIPINDTKGKVINLVGYSKDADERYVYGTAKYYRRRETLYGLENLELAYELGYAIRTEGITDAIMVRSLGFPNAFGNCGTHESSFITKQLNRCRYGVIDIPDRDLPGKRALNKWKSYRSITLYTFIKYKDIDAMCRESQENKDTVKEYLDICVDWIKGMEHNGISSINQEITIN